MVRYGACHLRGELAKAGDRRRILLPKQGRGGQLLKVKVDIQQIATQLNYLRKEALEQLHGDRGLAFRFEQLLDRGHLRHLRWVHLYRPVTATTRPRWTAAASAAWSRSV